MHHVIVILGPTASGKSSLGIALAKRFHGAIISADSRQVYRGMNLGTGKVTTKEMEGVPHYLLDVAAPRRQYTVAHYLRDVRRVLKNIPDDQPIFLVGGSPFYIAAITTPNSFSSVPPDAKLRRRLEQLTTEKLVMELRRRNPERLTTIDTANRRRLIRAIEIASTKRQQPAVTLLPMMIKKIGITINKTPLQLRIRRRLDQRLRRGLIAEVSRLHRTGLSWQRLDDLGLEYRFLARFLRGQLTRDEAVAQLQTAIEHFAKRQMTWWRRESDITWITKRSAATRIVSDFLKT